MTEWKTGSFLGNKYCLRTPGIKPHIASFHRALHCYEEAISFLEIMQKSLLPVSNTVEKGDIVWVLDYWQMRREELGLFDSRAAND